jgi:uncharacterized repeat protein (TIGR03803 family)
MSFGVHSSARVVGFCVATVVAHSIRIQCADLSVQTIYAFGSNPKNPRASLVQGSDGNFYGTTAFGGANGENGTVFQFAPGRPLIVLHSFQERDGAIPWAGLVQARDGALYGTTQGGGANGDFGTVFRMTTSGEFAVLYSFSGSDGRSPQAALVQGKDGNLYGTTAAGGRHDDNGTVFRITSDGVLTSLASFSGTNGRRPIGSLIQGSDGNFYGTTSEGGPGYDGTDVGGGTIFQVTPDGTMNSLFAFSGTDGSGPAAGLVEGSDGNFYGTTQFGGANDSGTVLKITPSGALTTLFSFNGADGSLPVSQLVAGSDGNFYGTTSGDRPFGGSNTFGTVFRVTPGGVLTPLVSFEGINGASPVAGLVQGIDGNLYGTTFEGGGGDGGTIFRLIEPPRILAVSASNGNVTITWASFINGTYRVEYRSSLTGTNWNTLPVEVKATGNTASAIDNSPTAARRFYRARLLP